MKRFLLLIFFISLLGCSKNPHATESGSGNIEISITLPSTKSARSGDEIKSLRIWLVDKNGKIVRVITSDAGSPAAGEDGITMTGVGTASAQFVNVERASYTLYFVANSDALSSYTAGKTIDDAFKKATIDYEYGINGMPLSVVKEIHVVPGKNMISASLVRICAKIHVTVRNSTLDKMIWIKDISLNDISPDKTYLFEQDSFLPGVVYEELEKITTPKGIAPNEAMTYPAVYLFETDKAPGIKIRGGVFDGNQTEEPGVTTQTISSYSFEETSESLNPNTGDQYMVMNKSMRYLLKGHPSGAVAIDFLASGDGPKNHLLASSEIEDYIWTYESQYVRSAAKRYYDLKNIGQNKYLRNSSGKLNLGTSIDNFTFNGNTTDEYTISSGSNYIWNNAGFLDFNNKGKSPQNQWYFYKVTSVSTTEEVFAGAEALINYADDDLNHIAPDLGVAVPLQRIKRNESINIRVNIFFNKNTGKLDFKTEIWKTVDNETTFD